MWLWCVVSFAIGLIMGAGIGAYFAGLGFKIQRQIDKLIASWREE